MGRAAGGLARVIPRALIARSLPGLPSDQLIEAIGNLEQRDALRWLRDAALAFVDARLTDQRARAAFEHPLAGAVFPYILADAYRRGEAGELGPWIDEYARRRPRRVLAALAGSFRPARRAPRSGPVEAIEAALTRALEASPAPRGLVVTAATDARTHALTRPVVDACRASGLGVVWLRLAPSAPSSHPLDVDAALPALDGEGTGQEAAGLRLEVQPAGNGAPGAMLRRLAAIAPEWAAGRRLGRAAIRAGAEFALFVPEKAPVARGIIGIMREHGAPTLAYLPSIELGTPAIARFAVDRVLVPSPVMTAGFVKCGVARERLVEVGSTEVDGVVHAARALGPRARGGSLDVLFLTKWPENAVDNISVLDATTDACAASGRPYAIRLRPHPKDRERYRSRLGPAVTLDDRPYEESLASADAIVTAMSNSAFHAIAVGVPLVIANLNPKIDLGQARLFARADLPPAVRYADTPAVVRDQVTRMLADAGTRYVPSSSLARDLFLSLDGGSAGRISAVVKDDVTRPREVLHHV